MTYEDPVIREHEAVINARDRAMEILHKAVDGNFPSDRILNCIQIVYYAEKIIQMWAED